MSFSLTRIGNWWQLALIAALLVASVIYTIWRWPKLKRRWKIGYVLGYAYVLVQVLYFACGLSPLWSVGASLVLLLPACVLRHDEHRLWRKINEPADTQNRGNK